MLWGGAVVLWYAALVLLVVPLAINTLLKAYLAVIKFPLVFGIFVLLFNWTTLKAVVLLSLLSATAPLLRRRGGVRLRRALATPAVLVAVLLAAGGWSALALQKTEYGFHRANTQPNRFGFYTVFQPSIREVWPGGGSVPDWVVETNSFGYRDKEWMEPDAEGLDRVLVVGDSFVFGMGIPDKSGLLSTQLEHELNAGAGERWEVLNVAESPADLRYYVTALRRVGEVFRPKGMVIGFLPFDLVPYSMQMILEGLSPWTVKLIYYFGPLHDIEGFSGPLYCQLGLPERVDLERMRALFADLVQWAQESQTELVVWEYFGAHSFFDPFRGAPYLTFRECLGDAGPCGSPPLWSGRGDPTLAYEGDGHPTPKANGILARELARTLRRLPGLARRPAGGPKPG